MYFGNASSLYANRFLSYSPTKQQRQKIDLYSKNR